MIRSKVYAALTKYAGSSVRSRPRKHVFVEAPIRFHSPQNSLDPFPDTLTKRLALMPGVPPLQVWGAAPGDLNTIRPDVPIAQGLNKVRGMRAFVDAHGSRVNPFARLPGQHVFRSLAFPRAGCGR